MKKNKHDNLLANIYIWEVFLDGLHFPLGSKPSQGLFFFGPHVIFLSFVTSLCGKCTAHFNSIFQNLWFLKRVKYVFNAKKLGTMIDKKDCICCR